MTRPCWWPRPPNWASTTSTGCWPIGSRWPTPTGPMPQTRSARRRGTSIWRRACRARGWARSPWTPSRARSWPPSSTGSNTTSSRPTVPRPKNAWAAPLGSTSWPAPRASAGPTPSSKWRRGAAPPPPMGIRPAPLFSVLVGYETMQGRICELENGTVLAPSALDPWMDSAYFERALFTLGNRVDVSVRSRLFTGGTRRAIELRDRICTHPYCYEPAENCQVDHIETYASGGETTQENGRLLCGFHNRLRNQREGHPRPAPAATTERSLTGRPPPGPVRPGSTPVDVMAGTTKSDTTPALWRARVHVRRPGPLALARPGRVRRVRRVRRVWRRTHRIRCVRVGCRTGGPPRARLRIPLFDLSRRLRRAPAHGRCRRAGELPRRPRGCPAAASRLRHHRPGGRARRRHVRGTGGGRLRQRLRVLLSGAST